MEKGTQKKEVRKNTSTKNLGPCYRVKGRIYTKKGKGILTVDIGRREDCKIGSR